MSKAVTTISTALRRAVEEAREKGECTVLCSDALLLEIAGRVEFLENERSSALRAQEQNEPQCKDCKHLGKAWACENCTHDRELRNRTSYYEPKGAGR